MSHQILVGPGVLLPGPVRAPGQQLLLGHFADQHLSRLLTGSIFQEPGDEEVELCAGEKDGETRAERPRGAGARGRVRPARRPRSAPTYPIAAPRGLSSHETCLRVTSGPPAGHPAAEGKRGRCRRLPCSCQCVLTSRASAPPFKQRRRRRRRRRRKQQLSGSGPGCGRLRRDPSAAERSPRLRGPHSPPPPPPPAGKGVPRPRPGSRAVVAPRGPARGLFICLQPEKLPEPKRRTARQALSLRRPPAGGEKGREGRRGARHGCAEGSDAHGAAAQALFSGAGWVEMEVSFYVAEIGNK